MKIIDLSEEKAKKAQWPLDCALSRIEEFDEIIVLAKAKTKGGEKYVRFSSALQSTFWWTGVLEAVKMALLDEAIEHLIEDK